MESAFRRQEVKVALVAATAAVSLALLRRAARRRLPRAFALERVVRPCVLRAKPYSFPPRFGQEGAPVLLDANENPHGPPINDDAVIRGLGLERYPDPAQTELKQELASLRGCHPEQVVVGVGSDEIIDLLIRITCSPGKDSIMLCSPTYAMYATFAAINDVKTVDVPLTGDGEFQLQPEAVKAALTRDVKLIFLCSPGNPTGQLLRRSDVQRILELATNSLVVVDEAYIDFALEETASASCTSWVAEKRYPNLVVSQTLSKAWGLAGARVGIAFASQEVVTIMDRVKAPFNLSILAEDAAVRSLRRAALVRERVRAVLAERDRVERALKIQPLLGKGGVQAVYKSDANFLLVKIANAKEVCEEIAKLSNVVVRYRGSMLHCTDCARISIGTKQENDAFLHALGAVLGRGRL